MFTIVHTGMLKSIEMKRFSKKYRNLSLERTMFIQHTEILKLCKVLSAFHYVSSLNCSASDSLKHLTLCLTPWKILKHTTGQIRYTPKCFCRFKLVSTKIITLTDIQMQRDTIKLDIFLYLLSKQIPWTKNIKTERSSTHFGKQIKAVCVQLHL